MKHTDIILDLVQRSLDGPQVDVEEFNNTCISQGLSRVVNKYGIKADREHLINFNDELADRVWEASIDFLATCGVYCTNSGRQILYSKDEINAILKTAPGEIVLGEGKDAVQELARKVEDSRRPLLMGSPIGGLIQEDLYIPALISYVQEPVVDLTMGPTLEKVYNTDIRTRTPLEIMAAWREAELTSEALRIAHRPGMAITGLGNSISDVGQLSADGPGRLRKTDLHTFGIISELKTNYEILNKLTHILYQDGLVDPYANPIYGGYGGGIDSQAVLISASMIALSVVFKATCVGSSPTHPFNFNDTGKEVMIPTSLAFQALARNSHLMTNLTITPVGGPATKTLLYECVAFTLMSTLSGCSRLLGPRSATGSISGHFSGLEARFTGELLRAACKLTRGQAEEIVQKAYIKYEADLTKKPYGEHFKDVYDIKTIRPKDEWVKIYEEVKNEVAGWGLSFD